MSTFGELTNKAPYRPNLGIKCRHTHRMRMLLSWVRFLSQPCVHAATWHEFTGTWVIISHAQVMQLADLERIMEWFPHMTFVFVSSHRLRLNARVFVTVDGAIADICDELAAQYPHSWYICASTRMDDEPERLALIAESHLVIAKIQPTRALYPFRHIYGQSMTLRYNGELWLQPWAKPTEVVTLCNYVAGCMLIPCETPRDYEQKMFYWNRYTRTGTTPERGHMRGIYLGADQAIEDICVRDCPAAREWVVSLLRNDRCRALVGPDTLNCVSTNTSDHTIAEVSN